MKNTVRRLICFRWVVVAVGLIATVNVYSDTSHTGMRGLTPQQIVFDMGVGFNNGNTLDAEGPDETYWGNPYTTKAMIDEMAKQGFKTLRLPVTWRFHLGPAPAYTIEKAWLDRVEEVANYAFRNNMYVIINIHHDDPWIIPTYEKLDIVKDKLTKVWTQIANRFKDYGDYLIFETINEPRYEGSPEEWTGGTAEGRDCVNQYHKACVDAIRATGGNNATRILMVSPYAAAGLPKVLDDFEIPNNDPYVIVSWHNYTPWAFFTGDKTTWGTQSDIDELMRGLDLFYNRFVAKGIPVVIGEWASGGKGELASRIKHAEYFTQGCIERGICPIWWDVGSGFFDKKTLSWVYPQIADVLVNSGNK